jgi:UDP-glucose 4-epimerase
MRLSEQFADTAVLVTGGSGFIGTHLCDRLLAYGARVHVISREVHQWDRHHFRWWKADLRDVAAVRQVLTAVQPQIVFHLSSYVAGARELNIVLPTFYDNLASTVHIMTASAEIGCRRIVVASSSEEPYVADDAASPCSPYAAAKWAGNMYGRMFHQLFQTPVVMPRIFMTYGPKQKDPTKLVPFVIGKLLRGETPLLTSGRRRADWIYIEDVVEGLLRAAVVPGIEGHTFDLGTGALVSVSEIVEKLVDIMETSIVPTFGAIPDRPNEQERAADTTFLSHRLDFHPSTELKQGLEITVNWYRERREGLQPAH